MVVDRFTKFVLGVIAFSLCLNALSPWLSPTSANAKDDFAIERAIKNITKEINRVADNIGQLVEIEAERLAVSIEQSESAEFRFNPPQTYTKGED